MKYYKYHFDGWKTVDTRHFKEIGVYQHGKLILYYDGVKKKVLNTFGDTMDILDRIYQENKRDEQLNKLGL